MRSMVWPRLVLVQISWPRITSEARNLLYIYHGLLFFIFTVGWFPTSPRLLPLSVRKINPQLYNNKYMKQSVALTVRRNKGKKCIANDITHVQKAMV